MRDVPFAGGRPCPLLVIPAGISTGLKLRTFTPKPSPTAYAECSATKYLKGIYIPRKLKASREDPTHHPVGPMPSLAFGGVPEASGFDLEAEIGDWAIALCDEIAV